MNFARSSMSFPGICTERELKSSTLSSFCDDLPAFNLVPRIFVPYTPYLVSLDQSAARMNFLQQDQGQAFGKWHLCKGKKGGCKEDGNLSYYRLAFGDIESVAQWLYIPYS